MTRKGDISRREFLAPAAVELTLTVVPRRVLGGPAYPVMDFTKHPGRFISMHLQGVDLNAPLSAPGSGQGARAGGGGRIGGGIAVGKDSPDWAEMFIAAKTRRRERTTSSSRTHRAGVAYLLTLNV